MQTAIVKVVLDVELAVDTDMAVTKLDATVLEAIRRVIADTLNDELDQESMSLECLGHYIERLNVTAAQLLA